MVTSCICKFEDFTSPWFQYWSEKLDNRTIHRKVWEWSIIAQSIHERGFLQHGMRGLGFAVGQEPLASLFASFGVTIDATDIEAGAALGDWTATGEHAASIDALFHDEIIDRAMFDQHVRFATADMNDLSKLPSNTYDFIWSSCALEHLGTIDLGLKFVREAMRLLKVGGLACHTTEFNISSLTETIVEGGNVLYRESDLRQLDCDLRSQYCCIERMDFDRGHAAEDVLYDSEPWGHGGHPHIKLMIGEYVCTSALLLCRRHG